MEREKIMDFLNLVEDALPVNQWKWDGISVWPLFRVLTYFQNIQREEFSRVDSKYHSYYKKAKSAFLSLASYYKASFVDKKQFDYSDGRRDIIFNIHSLTRSVRINHSWYSMHYDPLVKILKENNISSLCLEFAPRGEYRLPRYSPSLLIDRDLFMIKISSAVNKKTHLDDSFLYFWDQIKFLAEQNGEDLRTPSKGWLYFLLRYVRNLAEFYKKIFLKNGPSIGMVICYYGLGGMAFVLACNEFGIPSIDIQHGVQGALHVAYGRWNAVSGDGYNLLPDYFWCWSDEEAQNIYSWSSDNSIRHKPIVGGNLFLEQVQKGEIFFKEEENLKKEINNSYFKKHILVTLQPINYKGTLERLASCMDCTPKEWMWWIRLHPSMHSNKGDIVKFLEKKVNSFKNINVEKATDLPLYLLLKHVDVHITSFSSVVIEAEAFGVRSIIIDQLGIAYYKKQLENGSAIYAQDQKSIINTIFKLDNKTTRSKVLDNKNSQEAIKKITFLIKDRKQKNAALKIS